MQLLNDDFTNPRALATKSDVLWIAKQQAVTAINKVTSQPKGKITTSHATRQNWCFYHKRFGDDAKNCKAPCNHPAAPRIATVTTCKDKTQLYLSSAFSSSSHCRENIELLLTWALAQCQVLNMLQSLQRFVIMKNSTLVQRNLIIHINFSSNSHI